MLCLVRIGSKCSLPKSSTRRKSRFLFVIETARAFTLVGETRWPAPGEPLFSFSKRASAKKWRFGRVLRNYHQSAGRGLRQKPGLIPKHVKRKYLTPGSHSLRAAWCNQKFLAWVNELLWSYVVEATEFVQRDAILLGNPIEAFPGADLMVAPLGERKQHPLDS